MPIKQLWFGDCRLRKIGTDQEFLCPAAIWAHSYHDCRVLLRDHVRTMGYGLMDMLSLHAEEQAPQFSAGHDMRTLAQRVSAENPVALGLPAASRDQLAAPVVQDGLTIEALAMIEPQRPTDDGWQDGALPSAVTDILFGQSWLSNDDTARTGDASSGPPIRTYAILDATKFGLGASEIEGCDMPFQSLFIGKAARELADIAPYIVELDAAKRFTCRLFRHDPRLPAEMTSIHAWQREPGIYIRTPLSMEDVWRHFRHFTRVRDDKGAWFVLRFYDPNVALDMAAHLEEANRKRFFRPDIEVIALRRDGTGYRIRG